MSFALFQRPGAVVFLDDDADYLEMLALVLPRQWHVKLFVRPMDCISHLQQELPFWEADAWNQQQLISEWRAGKPLIPQILGYWSRYTERYALTRVCVFDYSMPGIDGIQALAELGDWPGSRVLLTGQADEEVAVRAFNQGLIEQFIPKQTPDITRRLVGAVEHLQTTPNARHAQIWRATLSPAQSALLRVPTISRDLAVLTGQRWVEHMVIGDPFGILGMDAAGNVSWLQLETQEGLKALAELAEVEGVPTADVAEIRQGQKLASFELHQALGLPRSRQLAPGVALGQDRTLFGALFDIDPQHTPSRSNSYGAWLARQERRRVQD
jgi:CheY-like chemotaxis protein